LLDPFAGSGSTLVAAALSGRGYVGIELEEKCQVARRRLAGVERFMRRAA
jgi:adenine-specific DNA-methyltransferase